MPDLEIQRAQGHLQVADEMLEDTLTHMRSGLTDDGAVRDQRQVLRSFVDRIEAEREGTSLVHIPRPDYRKVPPAEFESASPP